MGRKTIEDEFYKILHPMHTFILTSISLEGKPNACAVAWVTPLSEDPPMVLVALEKDHLTAKNIRETGEFVINIPGVRLLRTVWYVGTKSGKKVDKTQVKGITYVPSKKVGAPRVKESMGHLECRVRQTLDTGETFSFIADVVRAEVETEFFALFWKDKAYPLLHISGKEFGTITRITGNIVVKSKNIGRVKAELTYENPITVKKIVDALPITGKAKKWGDIVYFKVDNIEIPPENPREAVKKGEIGFWVEESSICIFFGKTPKSKGKEIIAEEEVNVFAKIKGNIRVLSEIEEGEIITIERP